MDQVPYRHLAAQVLDELQSKLTQLDDDQAKLFSKQLCAFYQHVVYQNTIPPPPQGEDSSMYIITMGVLMNHFLKHESPCVPHPSFDSEYKE
jgi:hypothetical protein